MGNGQRKILGPFFHLGSLLTDGQLYHYASGTTTLKNVYTDRAQTTAADQPLLSDANGIFTFFTSGLHKFVLKDVNDAEISSWDETGVQIPITGTWAPQLSFGNDSVAMVFTTTSGLYTQMGDIVFVRIAITLSAKGVSTGTARVSLPSLAHATAPAGGFTMTVATGLASLTSVVTGDPTGGSGVMVLQDWGATGSAVLDESNFTDTTSFLITGWYQVA